MTTSIFALAAAAALGAVRCGGAAAPQPVAKAPAAAAPAPATAAQPEEAGPRRAPAAGDFAFAIAVGEELGLVVAEDLEPFELLDEPELVTGTDADPLVLRQAVVERSLPDEIRALRGQAVRLYDGAKPVCEGGVVGFAAVGQLQRPGMSWAGEPSEGPPGTQEEIAAEAWSMAFRAVVAIVRAPSPCKGAAWGRLSSLPPPRFVEIEPARGEIEERAADAFRALPGYAEAQRGFDEEQERLRAQGLEAAKGAWDAVGSTDVARIPWSGRTLVQRAARVGEPCGFSASLEAIWEVREGRGGISLELLGSGVAGGGVSALLDVNGDGHLEAIVGDPYREEQWLVSWPDGDAAPILRVSLPYSGCPC
ncbi:MAG: hypothetical protein IT372_29625 [Polyangiaceae bacterium]|nr:hypothetical protein [Polyangiaceae bacterium]